MKITKVYTKTGDGGTTSLVGGVRINKSDVRLEAYGTIDELSSQLGLLVAYMRNEGELLDHDGQHCAVPLSDIEMVENIQNNLFCVGTYLATDQSCTPLYHSAMLPDNEIVLLEKTIDEILAALPDDNKGFILPGGTLAAATAHVCRTVCRRAERNVVALSGVSEVCPEVLQYINRISDYLFVLAKKLNFVAGKSEKTWSNHCG